MQYDPNTAADCSPVRSGACGASFLKEGIIVMENRIKDGKNGGLKLRAATPDDAAALLAIYAPYVTDTAITFEYDIPSEEEFRGRIEHTLETYPYIVAESDGVIVGYAYAGQFKERAAYDWAVETTVYVDRAKKRGGVGTALYEALEKALDAQGVLNVEACIGYPENGVDDEYLTCDSSKFHEYMGYRLVGEFRHCGYKFGRWYNMIWMEKFIGAHPDDGTVQAIKKFSEIADSVLPMIVTGADTSVATGDKSCTEKNMHTVTAAQMKQIEKNAFERGMPYPQMMENAGTAAYQGIRERYPEARSLAVFIGKGNNGGDGSVIARLAAADGLKVTLILAEGRPVTHDALLNFERIKDDPNVTVTDINNLNESNINESERPAAARRSDISADVTVDALYGTGFHGALRESGAKACAMMNDIGAPIAALDLPSGINADTGETAPGAVRADVTFAFDSYKKLHDIPESIAFCGEIILTDIGIPEKCHV